MLHVDAIHCTGCSACSNICPTGAIELCPDKRGFLYPEISIDKCIDCHLCEKVCMTKSDESYDNKPLSYYIAQLENQYELQNCQSGGASFALGQVCLLGGGVAYGAQYVKCEVKHLKATSISELERTCGSKYVQSNLRHCFSEIEDYLKHDTPILFTGTSCQVDGLYRYLKASGTKTDLLYTLDVICHGVTSPLLLKDYIELIEKNNKCNIESINMRDRRFSPLTKTVLSSSDGTLIFYNNYMELYYSNMALRDSCEFCKFTKKTNPADITIGDTVGLSNKYNKVINPSNPSSILIVHTKKGEDLLSKAKLNLICIQESEFSQPNLEHPTIMSKKKNEFWKNYTNKGAAYAFKRYTSMGGIKTKIRRQVLRLIGRW